MNLFFLSYLPSSSLCEKLTNLFCYFISNLTTVYDYY